jgi:hypothetical protein
MIGGPWTEEIRLVAEACAIHTMKIQRDQPSQVLCQLGLPMPARSREQEDKRTVGGRRRVARLVSVDSIMDPSTWTHLREESLRQTLSCQRLPDEEVANPEQIARLVHLC